MPWFVRADASSVWRRTAIAPSFAPAVFERTASGEWCLIAAPDAAITINGNPLPAGVHLLQHKDEIFGPDGALAYFTAEVVPEVTTFAGPSVKCARCRSAIETRAAAMQCGCGVWYHAECFDFGDDPRCVACLRPTRLDGSGLWSPEERE